MERIVLMQAALDVAQRNDALPSPVDEKHRAERHERKEYEIGSHQ
jgi:hypothetical protein